MHWHVPSADIRGIACVRVKTAASITAVSITVLKSNNVYLVSLVLEVAMAIPSLLASLFCAEYPTTSPNSTDSGVPLMGTEVEK